MKAAALPRAWMRQVLLVLVLAILLVGPRLVGVSLEPVLSGSMEPGIDTGDMVVNASTRWATPEVGSVVVFTPADSYGVGGAVMHRVVGEAHGAFITKGDANPVVDPWLVPADSITGVAVASIPSSELKTPWVLMLVCALVVGCVQVSRWWAGRKRSRSPVSPVDRSTLTRAQ